jgi:hypothetical protein
MSTAMWWATMGLSVASAALSIATAWVAWSTSAKYIQRKYPVWDHVREYATAIFDELRRDHVREIVLTLERLQAIEQPPEPRQAPCGLLVDLFMPPDRADDALYNLLGRYPHWVEKYGERWARVAFFLQCAGAIGTFWTDWLLKRMKLLKIFVSR